MRQPTEQDIEAARAAAVEATGRPDLTSIEIADADLCFVLRSPGADELRAYVDASGDTDQLQDTRHTLALRCVVWPSRDAVRKTFERFPLLAGDMCVELEQDAGAGKRAKVTLTDKLTTEQREISGLTEEQGRALLASHPDKGQLRAVCVTTRDGEELRFVLKRPSAFALSRLTTTAGAGSGFYQACVDAAVECIVWPADEAAVRDLFGRWKLLPSAALAPEILDMGSAGAVTRRKKL